MAQDFYSLFSPYQGYPLEGETLYSNPMMQPVDLGGQEEDLDPFSLAGLGGAAAFLGRNLPAGGVNPQVTGPVSQGLFQSSNIIGRNLPAGGANPQVTGPVRQGSLRPIPNQPVLIGQPQSYQGVPTGPNTPPQFTGNAPARPIPGTQLAPPNQPPAVSSAGGAPANTARPMKAAQRVGPPATINSGTPQAKPSLMKNVASGLFKTGAIGALTTPNTMADATLGGAYERRVAAGEDPDQVRQSLGLASDYREIQPLSGADLELANQYAADYAAEQAVTTTADGGGFFSPGGFGYEYLGGRLGETIGQFLGEQKYGTGLDVEGGVTGRPLNPRGLPGQTATLGASALELLGNYGIDPVVTAAQILPEYATGLDLTDSSLIDTPKTEPTEVQPAALEIPQGAPGSPQAFFEEYRSQGPLTPEQIARGEAEAARMGTTFDPDMGFSRDPFLAGAKSAPATSGLVTQSGIPLSEFLSGAAIPSAGLRAESPMYADNSMSRGFTGDAGRAAFDAASAEREGRLAARMQQPGETITERDTRLAGERTTGPRTYGGYTTAQLRDVVGGGDALRAAQMQAEMQGKQAEAEYLQEQQVAAQEAAYKQQQTILENNLKRAVEAAKPSTVQKAIDEVNSLIEEGTITQDQAKAAVLQRLKYDPEKLLSFDDVTGNGSTFTEEQESLIKKGMKKNPNYNREDIIKVLEEQGKL